MRQIFIYSLAFVVISCSGSATDEISDDSVTTPPKLEFKSFDERISYCIGLDHAFAAYSIYGAPDHKSKFDLAQIEAGMVDYLMGNDLRIPFESRDSIFNLYLLPNGEVDAKAVSRVDASYAIGMEEAYILVGSLVGRGIDQEMNVEFLVLGVKDGIRANPPAISLPSARAEVASYYSEINKENGEYFLAENAKRDSVITTESGLQYVVYKKGKGISPNLTDTCVVHYTERALDGREFISTIPSGKPSEITPLGLIPGFQEGLLLMKEGAQYRFFMPYFLAYGEAGSGPVEPFSTVICDIELIEVRRFGNY